jgi:hypothetical protein
MGQLFFISFPVTGTPGSGDVVGPGGATDNAVVRFDGPTGLLIKNSDLLLDNAGNLAGQNAAGLNLNASAGPLTLRSGLFSSAVQLSTEDGAGAGPSGSILIITGNNAGAGDAGELRLVGGNAAGAGAGADIRLTPGNGATAGSLVLEEAGGGARIRLNVDTTTLDYALTLPTAQGAASTLLQNDGSGNLSWASGAGLVPVFIGDSGAGGVQGLVPAPAAGDAAAYKYLFSGGNWQQVSADELIPSFQIASFTKTAPNAGTLTYRRGDTLTGTTVAATYTSGPPTSASLSNTLGGSVGGGDVNPGAWTFIAPFASGSQPVNVKRDGTDFGADPTWTIGLTATKIPVRTASVVVTWTRDVYWGVSSNAGPLTEAQIEALSNTVLSGTKSRTITVSPANEYVYYSYPAQYGAATFTLNGFPAAFETVYTVSVTNVNGITSTYNVYRSTNLLTGTNLNFVVT